MDGNKQAEARIAASLVEQRLLADLDALDSVVSANLERCPELLPFRGVAAAVLTWCATDLGLERQLRAGHVGDLAGDRVRNYNWSGETPSGAKGIVRYRVVEAGWNWRGRTLAKPMLEVAGR